MVEQVVGLRFVVDGEAEATAKLKTFQAQQEKVTNSIKTGAGIAKRLENDIKSLNAALGSGTISQKAFDSAVTQVTRSYKMLNEGVRGTSMSIQKATSDVQKVIRAIKEEERARASLLQAQQRAETAYALAMQRHNEEQRALQQQQAERLKLEAMYDRNAVAARVYENAVNNLNRAEQLGIISADRKAAELAQLNDAYQQVGTSAARTSNFINQFGEGASVAGIKTNRFGMYAQQVGYQVGDFFVQVQSGTNAFVAFGQQATQLAGLLPGVAGAIVGIGISVGTMLLAAWSRTNEATNNATVAAERYADALKNMRDEVRSVNDALYAMQRGLETEGEGTLLRQIVTSRQEIARLLSDNARLAQATDPMEQVINSGIVAENTAAIAVETQRIADAEATLLELSNARRKQNEAMAAIDSVQRISEENALIQAQIAYMRQGVEASEAKQRAEDDVLRATVQQVLATQQLAPEVRAQLEAFEATLDALRQSERELEKMRVQVMGVVTMMERLSGIDLDGAFYAAANAVNTMNARLDATFGKIRGIMGAIGSIGFENIALQAETAALRAGRSEGQARIEGQIAQTGAELRQSGLPAWAQNAAIAAQRTALEERLRLQTERDALVNMGADGGSGGGAADEFTSRVLSGELLEAIKRAQEETALYEKEVQMLDSALSSGLITQMEYNSYVQQAKEAYGQASQGAYDYEKAMEQVSNTAMSSMEDAFMSILDGSKSASDAFKDMARAIIAEAMRMLVIRPLLQGLFGGAGGGGFLGGLLNANGNAFIGGNVTAFANGGVVGGPTMFPMSGGRTGLMGEAGPEAIMPLKRTSSGKLGVVAEGGGAVSVQNVINVQGDNAAAVRQEIAKLMPTITEATKSAVIDARRRGGQMRAAFS